MLKMLKQCLIAGGILAVTTSIAVANPSPYVGGSIGIVTTTNSVPNNFRGFPVNVFVGYGGMVNQDFYLAGELSATLATGEISDSNSLKTSYGYGVSVLPGLALNDHTLGYARLGVVQTRFSSPGKTLTGGQAGLGLQTSLTQCLDLRGEYDYTGYSSFNHHLNHVSAPRTDAATIGLVYKIE